MNTFLKKNFNKLFYFSDTKDKKAEKPDTKKVAVKIETTSETEKEG